MSLHLWRLKQSTIAECNYKWHFTFTLLLNFKCHLQYCFYSDYYIFKFRRELTYNKDSTSYMVLQYSIISHPTPIYNVEMLFNTFMQMTLSFTCHVRPTDSHLLKLYMCLRESSFHLWYRTLYVLQTQWWGAWSHLVWVPSFNWFCRCTFGNKTIN